MQKIPLSRKFGYADALILIALGALIYGINLFASHWRADYQPLYEIDLSVSSLPLYTLCSAMRGIVALIISLGFALVVGYCGAKSKSAQKWLIPLLDIGQSIPILGFLPGILLSLIALFPHSNTGIELTAILMVFTSQVWNMTFSFYSSLKSMPTDLQELCALNGFSKWQKLRLLELPHSATNLAWNGMMSMAGGWFFLSICESFTLGSHTYQLPGIGAYMAKALATGNTAAMTHALIAMAILIVTLEMLIWRPLLGWTHRFRLEDNASSVVVTQSSTYSFIKDSLLSRWIHSWYQSHLRRSRPSRTSYTPEIGQWLPKALSTLKEGGRCSQKAGKWLLLAALTTLTAYSFFQALISLSQLPLQAWKVVLEASLATWMRILVCLILSTLWALPLGIWIGICEHRVKIAQPIIQFIASFPAPMIYPLVLSGLFALGIPFSCSAIALMMLGAQWYILFNVLAGTQTIPQELILATQMMHLSRWKIWKKLYLPSVFPSLVTGWVAAAGGSWNASIVAEFISYRGQNLSTIGLGALISSSVERADFPLITASLGCVVLSVVLFNRCLWSKLYTLAHNRFCID